MVEVESSGVGETSPISTIYDGAKDGHVNEVPVTSVDNSYTLATVLGGVGKTEYPCDIPV